MAASGGRNEITTRISLTGSDDVKRQLKDLGQTGEKAFGDISKATTAPSTALARVSESVAALKARFAAAGQGLSPLRDGFSTLSKSAGEFGQSLNNIAGSILPHWKEVLAAGTVGGAAGFLAMVDSVAKWGHELDENSRRLGLTPSELGAIGKAAKLAGVDMDHLVEGLSKFGINLEKAADDQTKTIVELAQNLAGKTATAFNGILDLSKRADSAPGGQFIKTASIDIENFRKQAEVAYGVLQKLGATHGETLEAFITRIQGSLRAGGDEAKKTTELLNKLGANIPAGTIFDELEQKLPTFRDAFAKLGVEIFDPLTGQVRNVADALGDFLDKFKDKTPTEQARLVRDELGRGFGDLIPIMQKGRAGLLEFYDALKQKTGTGESPFDAEVHAADELDKKLIRLNSALKGIQRSFVLPFAGVFEPLIDSVDKFLEGNKDKVSSFARSIAEAIKPIGEDFGRLFKGEDPTTEFGKNFLSAKNLIVGAIELIKAAFLGLSRVVDIAAAALNAAFGTEWTGKGLLITVVILKMAGVFAAVTTAAKLAAAAVELFKVATVAATSPMGAIVIGAAALGLYLSKDSEIVQKFWADLNGGAGKATQALGITEGSVSDIAKSAEKTTNELSRTLGLTTDVGQAATTAAGHFELIGDKAKAASANLPTMLRGVQQTGAAAEVAKGKFQELADAAGKATTAASSGTGGLVQNPTVHADSIAQNPVFSAGAASKITPEPAPIQAASEAMAAFQERARAAAEQMAKINGQTAQFTSELDKAGNIVTRFKNGSTLITAPTQEEIDRIKAAKEAVADFGGGGESKASSGNFFADGAKRAVAEVKADIADLGTLIDASANAINGDWPKAWEEAGRVAQHQLDEIDKTITGLSGIKVPLPTFLDDWRKAISDFFANIGKNAVDQAKLDIAGPELPGPKGFSEKLGEWRKAISDFFAQIGRDAVDDAKAEQEAIKNAVSSISLPSLVSPAKADTLGPATGAGATGFGDTGAATSSLDSISGKLSDAKSALTDFVSGIPGAISDALNSISDLVSQAVEQSTQFLSDKTDALNEFFTTSLDSLSGLIDDAISALSDGMGSAFDTLRDTVSSVFDWINSQIASISDLLSALLDTASSVASFLGSSLGGSSGAAGGNLEGFAGGGHVRGPGTGTSDSILARLSNYEFVNTARSVMHYGPDLFHALNNLQIPREMIRSMLGGMRGFAAGGLVASLSAPIMPSVPAFANGGLVNIAPAAAAAVPGAGKTPVIIQLQDGSQHRMLADDDVAEALLRKRRQAGMLRG